MKLEVNTMDHHYGSAQTLHGVDLALPSGECLAVMGTNGAGKTTLLKCLMGLEPLSAGTVMMGGQDVRRALPYERIRLGVGYVPQGREIFPDLTVHENLLIAADHIPRNEHRALLSRAIELFPVLGEMHKRRGGDLSGGQQQQLAIGRALMGKPKLLILDEPTEGIQPNVIQAIQDVIAELKGEMSILLVEQYFEFARAVADRYVVLARGSVVDSGATADLDPNQARELLAM